jgi:hypothetical protein
MSTVAAAGQTNTLAFQLDDNLIRVPVVLDGHKTQAVLDSGTNTLAVNRKFALSLGMRPGNTKGTVAGGGAADSVYPVTIAQLDFGPERLTDLTGIAVDLEHVSSLARFPVDVFLGRPAFEKRALRIDYPRRQITFFPPGAVAACADPIALHFAGGVPIVSVALQPTSSSAPATLHMIVDLGSTHWAAIVGGPFLDTAEGKALKKRGVQMRLATRVGGALEGVSVRVARMVLGTHTFSNVTVGLASHVKAFQDGSVDGSLGVPLWDKGAITLDDSHHRLCLDLPASSGTKIK